MKPTFALLASLLITPLLVVHSADRVAATTQLDVIYKTTGQDPLRLDLHYPAAPKAGAKYPLVLFTHGGKDPTIPVHHARYMEERAATVKAPVEVFIVENSGHNWGEAGGALRPPLDKIMAKTAAFLKRHLDGAPAK